MNLKNLLVFFFVLAIAAGDARAEKSSKAQRNSMTDSEQVSESFHSSNSLKPFKANHSILGGRLGQGTAYLGNISYGLNYEYMYSTEFGLGGQFFHSNYKQTASVGPIQSELTHRAFTLAALGNYHPAFIRSKVVDPYLSLGVAHTFLGSRAKIVGSSNGFVPPNATPAVSTQVDTTFLVAAANLRYFVDNKLSLVGTLALGMPTASFGLDYLF